MRDIGILSAVILVSAMLGGAARADDADQRYSLEKSADGYVRLDRKTGAVSICREQTGQLVCKLAADERSAFEDEVGRLQDRLSGLEKRIAALETAPRFSPDALLPSDEDFQKSLGYMERFFRSFMDIVRDFDKDRSKEAPGAEPQKT